MIDINTIELDVLIGGIFVIGIGFGIVLSFAQRCSYCNKIIFISKVNLRLPYEFGFYFVPYHRECYMKYTKIGDNKIVS